MILTIPIRKHHYVSPYGDVFSVLNNAMAEYGLKHTNVWSKGGLFGTYPLHVTWAGDSSYEEWFKTYEHKKSNKPVWLVIDTTAKVASIETKPPSKKKDPDAIICKWDKESPRRFTYWAGYMPMGYINLNSGRLPYTVKFTASRKHARGYRHPSCARIAMAILVDEYFAKVNPGAIVQHTEECPFTKPALPESDEYIEWHKHNIAVTLVSAQPLRAIPYYECHEPLFNDKEKNWFSMLFAEASSSGSFEEQTLLAMKSLEISNKLKEKGKH